MARTVTLHYTLRDPKGVVIDSSVGGEPISYREGAGEVIEGLEAQLRDAVAGLKRTIQVPAARAYGVSDPDQIQRVPRSALPPNLPLEPGATFQAGEDRHAPIVRVVAIEGDDVVLDANHPLAGVDLTFEVEVVSVRGRS